MVSIIRIGISKSWEKGEILIPLNSYHDLPETDAAPVRLRNTPVLSFVLPLVHFGIVVTISLRIFNTLPTAPEKP